MAYKLEVIPGTLVTAVNAANARGWEVVYWHEDVGLFSAEVRLVRKLTAAEEAILNQVFGNGLAPHFPNGPMMPVAPSPGALG